MVVLHYRVEKLLVGALHLVTFEVVILKLSVILKFDPANARVFEDAFLALLRSGLSVHLLRRVPHGWSEGSPAYWRRHIACIVHHHLYCFFSDNYNNEVYLYNEGNI